MSRPLPSRSNSSQGGFVRVNGKIRAREVRVIGLDGKQVGVLSLGDALTLARQHGVDLVEVAPTATPPVCRLVDYGKFRYEQAKREKESRKHQHAGRVKEIQLSVKIDPHDLGIKLAHAIDFLCEDMKVKAVLRFRGRELAHTELGFQVINKFLQDLAPYGRVDFEPKLAGRNITVVVSPLPRQKRARKPDEAGQPVSQTPTPSAPVASPAIPRPPAPARGPVAPTGSPASETESGGFVNNPFANLNLPGS